MNVLEVKTKCINLKKILFHSLTPLWIYISIVARLLSAAAFLIISLPYLICDYVAMLQLHLLNLYCHPQCALPQVSLRYNLFLIPPPPPCSPLHVSHVGRTTEKKELIRNFIHVAKRHSEEYSTFQDESCSWSLIQQQQTICYVEI